MIVSGIEVSGVCARSAPVFPGREEIILKQQLTQTLARTIGQTAIRVISEMIRTPNDEDEVQEI